MNQAWHLLKKDLRRLWPLLSLLYGMLLLQDVLALRDPLTEETYLSFGPLQLLLIPTVIGVVGMAVQQEPLVGTTAFWLTRPIRRSSLVLAKAAFLLAFVLAPLVLSATSIWMVYGLEAERYPLLLLETCGPLVSMVIASVVLAAVTPSLPVYFVAWLAGFLALDVASSVVQSLFDVTFFNSRMLVEGEPSRRIVFWVVIIVSGGLLTSYQYLTRKTRRSLVGLGIGFVLAVFVDALWPWDVLHIFSDRAAAYPQLVFSSPSADGAFQAEREGGGVMAIRGQIEARSGSPGLDFEIRQITGELTPRLGDPAFVLRRNSCASSALGRGEEGALPGYRWAGNQRPEPTPIAIRTLGWPTFDELIAHPGTLSATARGRAFRYRVAGTVPLSVGARFEKGSVAAVIRRISRGEAELHVTLRDRHLPSRLDPRPFPRILLINPVRREMLMAGPDESRKRFHRTLTGSGISGTERTFPFPLELTNGDEVVARIGDDWLADAELAFLEWLPAGRFETTLRVEDFRMHDATFTRQTVYAIE